MTQTQTKSLIWTLVVAVTLLVVLVIYLVCKITSSIKHDISQIDTPEQRAIVAEARSKNQLILRDSSYIGFIPTNNPKDSCTQVLLFCVNRTVVAVTPKGGITQLNESGSGSTWPMKCE
jgi:hypothetical protein